MRREKNAVVCEMEAEICRRETEEQTTSRGKGQPKQPLLTLKKGANKRKYQKQEGSTLQ